MRINKRAYKTEKAKGYKYSKNERVRFIGRRVCAVDLGGSHRKNYWILNHIRERGRAQQVEVNQFKRN
ncbi:hypothetical protein RRG08_023376 [Elysia crispata]|uniref:Uncharacterized protein n=1 Tax=Elysia crispata TaxID=231223 RepID=A0AAE1BE79_9GAST|nr:hypothetical protein RRG08_023376 [Elysia crispata]